MFPGASLENKVVIVTGGNGGIGGAIVRALANHGAKVAILDLKIDNEWRDVAEFQNGTIEFFKTDLTNNAEVNSTFEKLLKRYGVITHLVNAMGIGCNKPFLEVSFQDFTSVMNANLYSVILCCQAVIPHFKQNKYGFIINLSSTLAYSCLPNNTPYTLSKAALCALTRTLAKEFVGDGIVVNSVCPTVVKTKLFLDYMKAESQAKGVDAQEFLEMSLNTLPQKRALEPDEVAHTILYLCSDSARGITGQSIFINEGSYMI